MIEQYITYLAFIALIRNSFILCYKFLFNVKICTKIYWLNGYCECGQSNSNIYRIWGLSALWLIIKYKIFIEDFLRNII